MAPPAIPYEPTHVIDTFVPGSFWETDSAWGFTTTHGVRVQSSGPRADCFKPTNTVLAEGDFQDGVLHATVYTSCGSRYREDAIPMRVSGVFLKQVAVGGGQYSFLLEGGMHVVTPVLFASGCHEPGQRVAIEGTYRKGTLLATSFSPACPPLELQWVKSPGL